MYEPEHILYKVAENKRATHQEPRKFIKEGGLLAHDWATIAKYAVLLKPFKEATTCLQGRGLSGSHGAIWEVLITFEWLLTELENQKTRLAMIDYNDPDAPEDHLITNINAAHKKLSDYYIKLDDSPIYYAATVLHPTYKHLLEDLWKVLEDYNEQRDGSHPYQGWLIKSHQSFLRLWRSHKDKIAAKAAGQRSPSSVIRPVKRQKISPASGRAEFLRSSIKAAQKEVEQTLDDEYEAWKRQPPLQEENALAKQPIKY